MGRQARQISQTGLYHIIFRGISRQNIFEEESDYEKLKEIIVKVKEETKMKLYAYCFMSNHVHLFIKEEHMGQISKIMTKILSHYATWYNIKYLRTGTLFGSRYKSEPVEDEKYYMGLTRYIHQNPLKAGMIEHISEYPYSSYREYVGEQELVDTKFLLDMLSEDREKAIKQFKELNEVEEEEEYEISKAYKKSIGYIRRIIMSEIDGEEPNKIKEFPKEERNRIIKKLVNEKGISKSALERATGISRGTIIRIAK